MEKLKKYNILLGNFSNKNYLFVLFFSIFISVSFGLAYFLTRLGIGETNYKFILFNISISIFILLFPLIILRYFKKFISNYKYSFLGIEAFLSVCGIALLLFLSYIPVLYIKIFFLCASSLILFFYFIYHLYIQKILKVNILIFLIITIFSLWLFSNAWGKTFHFTYSHPLFKEEILTGDAFVDSLFHSSFANMIKTYNMPSTGLDGVPYIPYHFFSHWLFARFSSISNMNTLDFYQMGYQIIFIPLILKQFLVFIFEAKPDNKKNNNTYKNTFFWLMFAILFTNLLPKSILERFYIYLDLLVIESYNIGFFLLLISVSLILFFFNLKLVNRNYSVLKTIFFIFILPFLIFLIGITKCPFMVVFVGMLGYLFIRLHLFKKIRYIFSFVNILLISYLSFKLVKGSTPININLFHFFKANILIRNQELNLFTTIVAFILIYFLWSSIFIIYRSIKISKKGDKLFTLIKKYKLFDIEILVIVIFAGILPGFLLELYTGNATYFLSLQKWFSIILILIYVPLENINNISTVSYSKKRVYQLLKVSVFILLILILTFNTTTSIKDYVEYSKNIRQKYILNINSANDEKFEFKKKLLMILESLDKLPLNIKKELFIYIPHGSNNSIFWNLELLNKILGVPFIIPAVSGIALIDGVPDEHLLYRKYYGYSYYKITEANERINDIEYIFTEATRKGAKEIIVIDYYYLKNELVVNIINDKNYKDYKIINFINRNYLFTLNKLPSINEMNNIKILLNSGVLEPSKLSELLILRNNDFLADLSNKEFMEHLYIILLNRKYDEPGLQEWLKFLENTNDKRSIFKGFISSDEFKNMLD